MDSKDFLIAIPSRSRVNVLKEETYSFIKHSRYPFKIFVEPNQYDDYRKAFFGKELVRLDKNNLGLCYAKAFIQDYCLNRGIKYVFKLDDDLSNVRVRGMSKLKATGEVIDRKYRVENYLDPLIYESLKLLRGNKDIKGVSLQYGNEMWGTPDNQWVLNKRFQSSYIIDVDFLFPYVQHLYNQCFEDFDTFFNIVDKGFYVARNQIYGVDFGKINSPGGINDFKRREEANVAKENMSKRYPYLKWKKVEKDWDWEPDLRRTKEFKSISIDG